MAKAKPIYRVQVILTKFEAEFEGQHPWHWEPTRLRTLSVGEDSEVRIALREYEAVGDALTLCTRKTPYPQTPRVGN